MKKLTKLAAAVSLALLAGNASAALVTPATGTTGTSNLLFSLEDNNTASADYKHTFALNLGTTYAAILAGATGLSWNLNTISQFANFKLDTASLNWSVLGGEQRTSSNAATTWGALATAQHGTADFPVVYGTNSIRTELGVTGAIGGWYATVNPFITGTNVAADITSETPATSKYETKIGNLGSLQDSTGLSTTGAGSNDLWRATLPTTQLAGDLIQYSKLGTFSLALDSTGNNILTYNAVSAVPVPAAVWLFGSALAGFLGLSRRNKQVSAIAA